MNCVYSPGDWYDRKIVVVDQFLNELITDVNARLLLARSTIKQDVQKSCQW